MPKWTDEDIIVLVYFRSRGVLGRVVRDIVPLKGGAVRDGSKNITDKLKALHRKEQKAGRQAMYDKATKTWDLRVTDQWLVDLIVSRAKLLARVRHDDEAKAPLYYSELIALTEFKPAEQRMVQDVSPERTHNPCSPCVENLPQVQTLEPIMARLDWNVELPAVPHTETETNQIPADGPSESQSQSMPMEESNDDST